MQHGGYMDWYQVLAIISANIAMYITFSREMRDYHGRLCALEEKYIQMMQRFMEKK